MGQTEKSNNSRKKVEEEKKNVTAIHLKYFTDYEHKNY